MCMPLHCNNITQIHSIGCYGASHPLQETYVINTECKECFIMHNYDGTKINVTLYS